MSVYNNKKTLFYKLKSSCRNEWSEFTNHKFLVDLVNNKLPDKNFKKYLIQDYIFLQQFLRILSLSVYKSNSFKEINRSVNLIKGIDHEIKLHIDYLDILFKKNINKKLNKLKKNFKRSTVLERNFWQCFV